MGACAEASLTHKCRCDRNTIDEIFQSIKILRDCDFAYKNSSINEKHLMNSILISICGSNNG